MAEQIRLMIRIFIIFYAVVHAFPQDSLVNLFRHPGDIGEERARDVLIDDAVRNVFQLETGRNGIFKGDSQKAPRVAVFNQEIMPPFPPFLFLQVKRKQKGGRRLFRPIPNESEELRKQDSSPFFGLKSAENHLQAISEMTVIKGEILGRIESRVDHDPVQSDRGKIRGQIRVHLSPDHHVGDAESALFDDLVGQKLNERMEVAKYADAGQIDHEAAVSPAHQRRAERGRHHLRIGKNVRIFPAGLPSLHQVPEKVLNVAFSQGRSLFRLFFRHSLRPFPGRKGLSGHLFAAPVRRPSPRPGAHSVR